MVRRRASRGNGPHPSRSAGQSSGGRSRRSSSASPRAHRATTSATSGASRTGRTASRRSRARRASQRDGGRSWSPAPSGRRSGCPVPSSAASSSATVHPSTFGIIRSRRTRSGFSERASASASSPSAACKTSMPATARFTWQSKPDRRLVVGDEHAQTGLVCLGGCAQGLRDPRSVGLDYPRIPRLRRVFAAGGRTWVASRGEPVLQLRVTS